MTERLVKITGKGSADSTVNGLASSLFAVGQMFSDRPRCFFDGPRKPADGANGKWCSFTGTKYATQVLTPNDVASASRPRLSVANDVCRGHLTDVRSIYYVASGRGSRIHSFHHIIMAP